MFPQLLSAIWNGLKQVIGSRVRAYHVPAQTTPPTGFKSWGRIAYQTYTPPPAPPAPPPPPPVEIVNEDRAGLVRIVEVN